MLSISLCLPQPSNLKDKHILTCKLWDKEEQIIILNPWVDILYTEMDEVLTPSLKHLNCGWFRRSVHFWGRKFHGPCTAKLENKNSKQVPRGKNTETQEPCVHYHVPTSTWMLCNASPGYIDFFSSILKITASFVLILPNSIYLWLTMQFIYKGLLPRSLWDDQRKITMY